MARHLAARLDKLEQLAMPRNQAEIVVITEEGVLVTYANSTQHVMRHRGESDQALIERAVRETHPTNGQANAAVDLRELLVVRIVE